MLIIGKEIIYHLAPNVALLEIARVSPSHTANVAVLVEQDTQALVCNPEVGRYYLKFKASLGYKVKACLKIKI